MRVIKFRGKRVDNGEWVYGHYTEGSPNYHYITQPSGDIWQIDPATVGQFTGLVDKDSSEIYEGDILCWLKYERTNQQKRWVVKYDPLNGFVSWSPIKDAQIIGNIYDMPELIEGGNQ